MRSKGFDLSAYALNHPSGTIGKKMSVTVEELMFKDDQLPLARPHVRLSDLLAELTNKKLGALIIVDEGQNFLSGFSPTATSSSPRLAEPRLPRFGKANRRTDDDQRPHNRKREARLEALKIMQKDPKKFVMALPVLEQGKAVGFLRMHDIVQAGIS